MKEKTFYKTLLAFSQSPETAKKCLSDKRLTPAEKIILECYLKIRNNENLETLELLQKLRPSESLFIESQRLQILGYVSNNLSHFKQAEEYLVQAITIHQKLETHYFHFLANFNLFWVYANLNETSLLKKVLDAMNSIPCVNENQKMRLLRCHFCYHYMLENNDEAKRLILEIEKIRPALSESDTICYLTDKFMFYIQLENFEDAYEVLTDMKSCRKFHLTENYKFSKKLLDHLTKDTPVYAYEQDFESTPVLLHQIKVIQALEEKNMEAAEDHWRSLKLISSTTYQDDFQFHGTKCLFSLSLNKHRQKVGSPSLLELPEGTSKLDALIAILTEAQTPLPKGHVYELLWGETPVEKSEFNKLGRLVFRAKKEKNIDIEFRKGTYSIARKIKSKVS